MIKLFGKARFEMFQLGKTKQYFIYALGEIFLVVIGILIALQINNWNEGRREKQVERAYLLNLKEDLLRDKNELINSIERRKSKVKSAETLLGFFNGNELKNFDEEFYNLAIWEEFIPNLNAYTEILSSGDLRIIRNSKIKTESI